MELKDLSDSMSVFTLKYNNEEIKLELTPFSLDKINHLVEHHKGQENFQKSMANPTPRDICYMLWILLDVESKAKLFSYKWKEFDESIGKVVESNTKGHEKIMAMISTVDEYQELSKLVLNHFAEAMPKPKKQKKGKDGDEAEKK